jgi:Aromatic acid exporter family member 1
VQSEVPRGPATASVTPASGVEAGNDADVATWRSAGRRLKARLVTAVLRIRRRWRSAAFRAARLTGASVAAYLAAEGFGLVDPPPLVAALTALLVVQATASSTLFSGVERVLAVVAGVALAMGFVSVVGLTWWSLGVLVAASIIVGYLLRLGPNLIEVPISAMLVLGVGYAAGAQATGLSRVVETLIGAAVGVLVNVLFPPAVRSRYAGQAIQRLAEEIAALLDEAAEGLGAVPPPGQLRATDSGNFFPTGTGWFSIPSVDRTSGDRGLTLEATRRWLDDARRLNRHVPRVDRALTHAEESRRLNVRALRSPESTRSLRGGLEALELCSVAVRSMFRSIDDWVRGGMVEPDPVYATRARAAWAELLTDLAVVVRAFGALLRAEVEGSATAEEAALADALDRLRLDRVRHAETLLADPREHPDLWELDGALVGLVDRMLLELDTAAHAALWQDRRREIIDPHRAVELFERLRPARRAEARGEAPRPGAAPAATPPPGPRPPGPRRPGPRPPAATPPPAGPPPATPPPAAPPTPPGNLG